LKHTGTHTHTHTHTGRDRSALSSGCGPAAGKALANYSLSADFFAQCAMRCEAVWVEFMNSLYHRRGLLLPLTHSHHLHSDSICKLKLTHPDTSHMSELW